MSYCRFGEADVYVFLSVDGSLECCGCWLQKKWDYPNTDAMIAHLREHQEAGHRVPERVFTELADGRDENDAWIAEQAE